MFSINNYNIIYTRNARLAFQGDKPASGKTDTDTDAAIYQGLAKDQTIQKCLIALVVALIVVIGIVSATEHPKGAFSLIVLLPLLGALMKGNRTLQQVRKAPLISSLYQKYIFQNKGRVQEMEPHSGAILLFFGEEISPNAPSTRVSGCLRDTRVGDI